jgi:hypothetical protein
MGDSNMNNAAAADAPMHESQLSGNRVITDATAKLHDRLRKLLVMSKEAATEAEAQQAASLLQKFLTEHNLDVAQLEAKGAAAPHVHEAAHDLGKAAFKWKLDLAEYIAEHYYCAGIVDRKAKTVAFVGRPDNVQSLQMLYAWIIDQIKRIANDERHIWMAEHSEHMDPLRWQVNFGEGAATRLAVRLADMKDKQAADLARNADGDVVGLALHHAAEVSDYLEQNYGYRTDGRMTKEELAREERWAEYQRKQAAAEAAREELLRTDPAEYYRQYPWAHPDAVAKREAQAAKERAAEVKREARNAKRRGRGMGREERDNPARERQESQAWQARVAGRRAADRVNLQPFLGGSTGATKKKVTGGRG